MPENRQDMEQQLRDLGVSIDLAKNGITISEENIVLVKNFLSANANLAELLEKISLETNEDIILNLLWLSKEQLSAVLNAILKNPEGFAGIMGQLTGDENLLKSVVEEVSSYS